MKLSLIYFLKENVWIFRDVYLKIMTIAYFDYQKVLALVVFQHILLLILNFNYSYTHKLYPMSSMLNLHLSTNNCIKIKNFYQKHHNLISMLY